MIKKSLVTFLKIMLSCLKYSWTIKFLTVVQKICTLLNHQFSDNTTSLLLEHFYEHPIWSEKRLPRAFHDFMYIGSNCQCYWLPFYSPNFICRITSNWAGPILRHICCLFTDPLDRYILEKIGLPQHNDYTHSILSRTRESLEVFKQLLEQKYCTLN